MKFTKMQGIGNDYVYVNCFDEQVDHPEKLAIEMSERHFGVGADGLVLIMPDEKADFRMRMFNADGSEGEMCGNATRCIGRYVYDRGLTNKTEFTLNTLAGIKNISLRIDNGIVKSVTVDMGEPILEGSCIPVCKNEQQIIDHPLAVLDRTLLFTCVSMGNPHAVTFVEATKDYEVEKYGTVAEKDDFFPNRANIEFVQVVDDSHLNMRVWERGSGETWACGTGACAVLVAAVLKGYCKRSAEISLLGGALHIHWNEKNNHVYMTGPAEYSFDGEWLKPL